MTGRAAAWVRGLLTDLPGLVTVSLVVLALPLAAFVALLHWSPLP